MRRRPFTSKLSVFYKDQAWEIDKESFDMEKFKAGTQLFIGTHFMKHFVKVNTHEVSNTNSN